MYVCKFSVISLFSRETFLVNSITLRSIALKFLEYEEKFPPFFISAFWFSHRGQSILFSVVFTPLSSQPPCQCLSPTCHLSSLNYNTVSQVRACLIIRLERFRGTQNEDDREPLSIQSSLGSAVGNFYITFCITCCTIPLKKETFLRCEEVH
jgi:hypothetical protein